LAKTWTETDPSTDVKVVRTIEEAVAAVRAMASLGSDGENVTALVTGSLHVVGGLLEVFGDNGKYQCVRYPYTALTVLLRSFGPVAEFLSGISTSSFEGECGAEKFPL